MKRVSSFMIAVALACFFTTAVAQLSGDYVIGTGQTYATLGAAITALNTGGASGTVRFLIDENLSETGSPVITTPTLNGTNTLVIKPNVSKTPTVTFSGCATTGNNAYSGLTIDGATCPGYVTIDGSNTNGGTTRDMTFTMNDATNGDFCIKLSTNTDNIIIKNLKILAQSIYTGTAATAGIAVYGSTTTASLVADNLTITNCQIGASDATTSYLYGISVSNPTTPATYAGGMSITNNAIYASARCLNLLRINKTGSTGTVSGNTLSLLSTNTAGFTHAAIYLENWQDVVSILNNKLVTLKMVNNHASTPFTLYGIHTRAGVASSVVNIYNNFICDFWVSGTTVTTNSVFGIEAGSSGSNVAIHNIYYNSVYLNNEHYSSNTGTFACLHSASTTAALVNAKNNILVNTINHSLSYGVRVVTNSNLASSDHNDIHVPGASAFTGYYNALNQLTLTNWRDATGKDANSNSFNPDYTSVTDLHLNAGSVNHNYDGTPIGGYTVDIDGDSRDPILPYKGADEAPAWPLPIQLESFTASYVENNNAVRLNWATVSEANNYGFHVQKKRTTESTWSEIANSFVAGHGTTNLPQHYVFTDNQVAAGTWQYRLKQVDLDGSIHFAEPINVSSPTSVAETAPVEFTLKQNYPNPYNPETNIKFSVGTAGLTTLDIYNAIGQNVGTLFDGIAEPGHYYTVKLSGQNLSSGVYLYRLQSGSKASVKKLVLLK